MIRLFFSRFLMLLICGLVLIFIIGYIPTPKVHEPEALITKDGCTIYKWYDKGNRMYYTKCEDGSSPTISR